MKCEICNEEFGMGTLHHYTITHYLNHLSDIYFEMKEYVEKKAEETKNQASGSAG